MINTLEPFASNTAVKIYLAKALYKDLNLTHVDIKTAFLHVNLQENVCMHPNG